MEFIFDSSLITLRNFNSSFLFSLIIIFSLVFIDSSLVFLEFLIIALLDLFIVFLIIVLLFLLIFNLFIESLILFNLLIASSLIEMFLLLFFNNAPCILLANLLSHNLPSHNGPVPLSMPCFSAISSHIFFPLTHRKNTLK